MNTVVFLGLTIGDIIKYVIMLIVLILLIKLFFPKYRKVEPNEAVIISGPLRKKYKATDLKGEEVDKKFGYRIVRGGATFYFPAFEKESRLDLSLITIDIKTSQPVQTKEYASIKVDGVANVKIGSDSVSIANAAEQLLNWSKDAISKAAIQVLEGSLREIVGGMTIAELETYMIYQLCGSEYGDLNTISDDELNYLITSDYALILYESEV